MGSRSPGLVLPLALLALHLLTPCCCHAAQSTSTSQPQERSSWPQLLTSCINSRQPNINMTTWDGAMSDVRSAVHIAGVWWSAKQREVPLTVVTQLSFDRVDQLLSQCKSWSGPISAVLYIALDHSDKADEFGTQQGPSPKHVLSAAVTKAAEIFKRMEDLPCQADLMLAYERFDSSQATMLYPINILRNYAKLQARTPLIGLFDADMLVSRSLHQQLSDPVQASRYVRLLRGDSSAMSVQPVIPMQEQLVPPKLQAAARHLQQQPHGAASPVALVLPAFVSYAAGGLRPEHIADRMVNTTKSTLAIMWGNEVVSRFDPRDRGHLATQYERWFNTSEAYEVSYSYRYEPWVVVDRQAVPWYDVRFRGYGQNKIVHLEYLNYTGFRFVVHPSAWLIHRAHPLTKVKLQHAKDFTNMRGALPGQWYRTVYGHASTLGQRARLAMSESRYTPVYDEVVAGCSRELPWWGEQRRRGRARQHRRMHGAD